MTKQDQILDYLVSKNMFFCLIDGNGLVSVQDLLTQKLGRPVEFDEAVQFLKKKRFIYKMCNRCKK